MVDRSTKVRLTADVSNFERNLARAGTAARAFKKDLDDSNNQMSLMIQSAVALAPAAVSMGAAAVPAIAGMATAFTAAATAAGVAALAFSGVGDAVSALGKFQLEPTEANLGKVREEMQKLGVAGRDFAFFLDSLRPKMQKLQATAQSGMFPGMEAGIRSLMNQFPIFNRLIDNVATATGDLAEKGGEALNSPFWTDFFDFLATDASQALLTFGETIGNFAEGFAGMFQAFGPLSKDFNDGLLDISANFAAWGRDLSENEGFEDFVDYIRRVTPQVQDTLSAIGDAFIDLTVAASDIGPAVLQGLELVADVVAAIARTDAGPVLIGLAAGMSALARVASLGSLLGFGALFKVLGPGLKSIGTDARALPVATGNWLDYGRALDTTGKRADAAADASKRLRGSIAAVGKAGAGIAGLSLLLTDFDNDMGVANTATLTLMGTMAGPWGAALGAAAGVVMDFIAVNDQFEDSLESTNAALGNFGDFQAQEDALRSLRGEAEELDSFKINWQDLSPNRLAVRGAQEAWGQVFGGDSATEQAAELEEASERVRQAISDVNSEFGRGDIPLDDYAALEQTVEDLRPAFEHAGIDFDDWLSRMQAGGLTAIAASAEFQILRNEMFKFDNAAGSSANVREAIRELGDEIHATTTEAEALKTALDELFGPKQGLIQATDEWSASLRSLKKEIREIVGKKGSVDIFADSADGEQIRSALNERVDQFEAVVFAAAEAGAKEKELTGIIRGQAAEFVRWGVKAGLQEDQLRQFLKAVGLVPKEILPRLDINTKPGKRSIDDMTAYMLRKLGIVEDNQPKIDADTKPAHNKIDEFEDGWQQTITDMLPAKIDADTAEGKRKVRELVAYINDVLSNDIDDEGVKIELTAQAKKVQDQLGLARGGPVPLFGGTAGKDSVKALLMPDEHVWTTEEVQKAGGHEVMYALRRMAKRGQLPKLGDISMFASGGAVVPRPSATGVMAAASQIESWFDAITAQIGDTLSALFSKKMTQLPVAGQLGPNGNLTPAQLVRGQEFAKSQAGKPYLLGGVGPGAYDCSGAQSATLNAAIGRYPYSRLGSTSTMPWVGSSPGVGRYTIGWSTAGNIAGSSLGHTSGNIGGLGIESSGDVGFHVGSGARSPLDPMFSNVMHYDSGGRLKPGWTAAYNGTGSDEYVFRMAEGGAVPGSKPLSEKMIADVLKEIRDQFGKNSPIIDIIASWLERIDRDDFSNRALNRRIDRAVDRQVDPAMRGFNVSGRQSVSETRSEIRDLLNALRETLGADSPVVARMAKIGERLLEVQKRQDKLVAKSEREHDDLQQIIQNQRAYAQSVTDAFRPEDPFGGDIVDLRQTLGADTGFAKRSLRNLRELRSKGLDGGLFKQLAASGNVELIAELSDLNRKQIARLERQFANRNKITASIGQLAGREIFGDRRNRQEHVVNHLDNSVQKLNHTIDRLGNKPQRVTIDLGDGKKLKGWIQSEIANQSSHDNRQGRMGSGRYSKPGKQSVNA